MCLNRSPSGSNPSRYSGHCFDFVRSCEVVRRLTPDSPTLTSRGYFRQISRFAFALSRIGLYIVPVAGSPAHQETTRPGPIDLGPAALSYHLTAPRALDSSDQSCANRPIDGWPGRPLTGIGHLGRAVSGRKAQRYETMSKKLYVGNLTFDVTDDQLRGMFDSFGSVQSAQVIMDRDTGRSKGFGFVEMSNDQEAQAAIAGLNGQMSGGRALTVNEAKPKEDRPRSGGGGGGGGGRGGYGGKRY
jgi:cold-inducible RNA-binding protein